MKERVKRRIGESINRRIEVSDSKKWRPGSREHLCRTARLEGQRAPVKNRTESAGLS
jgi:hypothetical protein